MAKYTNTETDYILLMIKQGKTTGHIAQQFRNRPYKSLGNKIKKLKEGVKPVASERKIEKANTHSVDWGNSMRNNIEALATKAGAVERQSGWWYKNGKRITITQMYEIVQALSQ